MSLTRVCGRTTVLALLLLASNPEGFASERGSGIPAGEDFGAGLTLAHAAQVGEVTKHPERYVGKPVLVHGKVSQVCQRKGCWMILRDGEAHVRVRFKDYGFFLPKDCSGKEAYVEGVVQRKRLSERTARHYESETPGGDPSKVKGARRELGILASGVRLIGSEP